MSHLESSFVQNTELLILFLGLAEQSRGVTLFASSNQAGVLVPAGAFYRLQRGIESHQRLTFTNWCGMLHQLSAHKRQQTLAFNFHPAQVSGEYPDADENLARSIIVKRRQRGLLLSFVAMVFVSLANKVFQKVKPRGRETQSQVDKNQFSFQEPINIFRLSYVAISIWGWYRKHFFL